MLRNVGGISRALVKENHRADNQLAEKQILISVESQQTYMPSLMKID